MRTRLETVREGNESGAPFVDRRPMMHTPASRSYSELSTASTRSSTSEPGHLEDGCDGGRAPRAAAAHRAATATGVCANARAGSDATARPAPLEQAEEPQVDTRPVRGVATLQTCPSVTGRGKPMRVLLVASRDTFFGADARKAAPTPSADAASTARCTGSARPRQHVPHLASCGAGGARRRRCGGAARLLAATSGCRRS